MLLKGEDGSMLAQTGVSQDQIEEEGAKAVEEGDAKFDDEDEGSLYKVPHWQTLYCTSYMAKRGGGVLARITKKEEKGFEEKRIFESSASANRFKLGGFMRNPAFSFWSPKIDRKDDISDKMEEGGSAPLQCGNVQCNKILLATARDPVWYPYPIGKKSIKRDWTRISKRGRETEASWHPYKRDPIYR